MLIRVAHSVRYSGIVPRPHLLRYESARHTLLNFKLDQAAVLRILLDTPARLPSFLSDFLAPQGNYKQDASAVPGVRWVAERRWRDQSTLCTLRAIIVGLLIAWMKP
jgi:hypothetical protein